MQNIILIRPYRGGDQKDCNHLFYHAALFSLIHTYCYIMMNKVPGLLPAVLFISIWIFELTYFTVGIVCFVILILPIILISFNVERKFQKIIQEDILSVYNFNSVPSFWVAEALELKAEQDPSLFYYHIMTEDKFVASMFDSQPNGFQLFMTEDMWPARHIIGTIGLCKNKDLVNGMWLKRLCINNLYSKKGVQECLLKVAIEFANSQTLYKQIDTQIVDYDKISLDQCLLKGFHHKQEYEPNILERFLQIHTHEMVYQINQDNQIE